MPDLKGGVAAGTEEVFSAAGIPHTARATLVVYDVLPGEFEVLDVAPAPGSLLEPGQALNFSLRSRRALRRVLVCASFAGFDFVELAYDGAFQPLYAAGSAVVDAVDPGWVRLAFSLVRAPLWPGSPTLTVYAFDTGGGEL